MLIMEIGTRVWHTSIVSVNGYYDSCTTGYKLGLSNGPRDTSFDGNISDLSDDSGNDMPDLELYTDDDQPGFDVSTDEDADDLVSLRHWVAANKLME